MCLPFSKLKNSGLRTLLHLIGAPSTGTKPVLLARLQDKLSLPTMRSPRRSSTTRILSIDMGIKNLAYCVADVSIPSAHPSASSRVPSQGIDGEEGSSEARSEPVMTVTAWRRVAVQALPATTTPTPASVAATSPSSAAGGEENPDPFHPRALAAKAHVLLTTLLLPHAPHTLLIERQRYRSGGAAAVQDWTYRVNLFEGMLWAVLGTLRGERAGSRSGKGKVKGERKGDPEVWDVSPARVVGFWVGEGKDGKKRGAGAKGKKEKVGLVGKWVAGEGVATAAGAARGDSSVRLDFAEEAEAARKAFVAKLMKRRGLRKGASKTKAAPKRKKTGKEDAQILVESVGVADSTPVVVEGTEDIGKLDDLADCLLQAAAWVQWEANRRHIAVMDEEELLDLVDGHSG